MNLVRWEPFQDLVTLRQAMNSLFEDSFVKMPHLAAGGNGGIVPAVDIIDTADRMGIRASLPGVKPDDIDINISPEGVTIKGESKSQKEVKEENYVRKECRYGLFTRTIPLPPGLKIDMAEATMDHGILTLEIPKAEEIKTKTVKIKARAVTEPKKLATKEAKA